MVAQRKNCSTLLTKGQEQEGKEGFLEEVKHELTFEEQILSPVLGRGYDGQGVYRASPAGRPKGRGAPFHSGNTCISLQNAPEKWLGTAQQSTRLFDGNVNMKSKSSVSASGPASLRYALAKIAL